MARLAFALVVTFSAAAAPGAPAPEAHYNLGFFRYMFAGAPETDARAAFKSWLQTAGRESGLQLTSTSRIFNTAEEAADAATSGSVDIIVFSSIDYLTIRSRLPAGALLSPIRRSGQLEEYLLICEADAGPRDLAAFKGRTLLRQSVASAPLAGLWLESELHAAGLPPSGEHFGSIDTFAKPAKVLLPVYFKQADLCLITRSAYEMLCELNPQIAQKVHILAQSPPYISTLVWLALPAGSSLHAQALDAVLKLQHTASGRQTLLLFQFLRFEPCPENLLASAEELLARVPHELGAPSAFLLSHP